jgi:hypothetical protein
VPKSRVRPLSQGSVSERPFAGLCCWPSCEGETGPVDGPLCEYHLTAAFRIYRQTYMRDVDDAVQGAFARVQPPVPLSERDGVVYFVRFQNLVKIGFTTNLPSRMVAIPHEEVLGTVAGTLADEKRCHAAFAHLRVKGEWFRPETERGAAGRREATGLSTTG